MTYTREQWAALSAAERGPCDEWPGARNAQGYGYQRAGGRCMKAHRVAWIRQHGDPPLDTPQVLHHCDNPPCRNVDHLFLGTCRVNVDDRVAKGRTVNVIADALREASHCFRGHEFTSENTRWTKRGHRNCRTCNRDRTRRRRAKVAA